LACDTDRSRCQPALPGSVFARRSLIARPSRNALGHTGPGRGAAVEGSPHGPKHRHDHDRRNGGGASGHSCIHRTADRIGSASELTNQLPKRDHLVGVGSVSISAVTRPMWRSRALGAAMHPATAFSKRSTCGNCGGG
jgi:hypothetical protein